MNFKKVISERYSVRDFKKDAPVEAEKLNQILEAARIAPTACNFQPHLIKVLNNSDALAKIDACTRYRFGAPVVLLVCYDNTRAMKSSYEGSSTGSRGETDCAIAMTYMMLQAQDLGVGSLYIMNFDPQKTHEVFGLADNIVPVSLLALGYPTEKCKPSERHFLRRKIQEMLI